MYGILTYIAMVSGVNVGICSLYGVLGYLVAGPFWVNTPCFFVVDLDAVLLLIWRIFLCFRFSFGFRCVVEVRGVDRGGSAPRIIAIMV